MRILIDNLSFTFSLSLSHFLSLSISLHAQGLCRGGDGQDKSNPQEWEVGETGKYGQEHEETHKI